MKCISVMCIGFTCIWVTYTGVTCFWVGVRVVGVSVSVMVGFGVRVVGVGVRVCVVAVGVCGRSVCAVV